MRRSSWAVLFLVCAAAFVTFAAVPAPQGTGYHLLKKVTLGGQGGWDYLTADPVSHRVFLSRGTHIMVVDAEGEVLGSVGSLQVGDVADNFAFGIYNHDMRAARKEDAVRHGISGEIVPAALAAQRHLLQQMIARALGRGDCRKSHKRRGANEKHSSPNCSSHRIPPS